VGRSNAPFGTALTARTEVHQGDSGSAVLTLDYPIASITSIGIGRSVTVPDETIIPTDTNAVLWQPGTRDLIRVDGGYWRGWYHPTWVQVVYNTQDYQPDDVKLAIKQKVALIYQGRGKEGFSSVTRGSRSWTMADPASQGTEWDRAINNYRSSWVR
jgi:hypothetical protein